MKLASIVKKKQMSLGVSRTQDGLMILRNSLRRGCAHAPLGRGSNTFVSGQSLPRRITLALVWIIILSSMQACDRPDKPSRSWDLSKPWLQEEATIEAIPPISTPSHSLVSQIPPTRQPGELYFTPTPDIARNTPQIRTETEHYVVQPGDSLNGIAIRFGVSARQIIKANNITNPNALAVWQVLTIPAPIWREPGPSFKIIPNSELVYGPASVFFSSYTDVISRGGFLQHYSEVVEGQDLSGWAIVQLVAQRYSVNPQLLLAVLEYQSGWLTSQEISPESWFYPVGFVSAGWEGLFNQLSYAANQLNTGYYLWRAGWPGPYVLRDGSVITPGVGINAGTVGLQYLFSQLYSMETWRSVVGETGFYQTYVSLFGNPFDRGVDPLVPHELEQPQMQLPFESGKIWSFTSGPHSAWDMGAAWAALDFSPPGNWLGCVNSDEWVVAVADGLIVRTGEGEVILDIDGDGYEQTGWVLLYMHMEERDRIQPGVTLHAGDRIGHPSCEGGIATGTHLHLARKYNGEWIPADGPIPFIMDSWVSAGQGTEYDGTMSRESTHVEAYFRRVPNNQISR